jgi:prolyl oligopeptidase
MPLSKTQIVEETLHGVTIRDPFRYLEDANNRDTQRFVEEQNARTRRLLDRVPEREEIESRLEQLLGIGVLGAPQVGGRCYF